MKRSLIALPRFLRNLRRFRAASVANGRFPMTKLYPCLGDAADQSGSVGQYWVQDVFVASRIFQRKPRRHVDVGSRIDGFVGMVASYRDLVAFDLRPPPNTPFGIRFVQADFMSNSFSHDAICDSLSCLHALEHFGLGRYGDPVDPEGHLKGLNNLYRMLEPEGILYLSVPIGPQRIEFDAHRVFAVPTLLELFTNKFMVKEISYIDDQNKLFVNVPPTDASIERSFDCHYGCGIFELKKIS
jgi:SAM-dependent methyltransferase